MIEPGQIVTITGQPAQWVVAESHATGVPPGRRWRCERVRDDGLHTSRIVGDGDLTVLGSPTFEIGEAVKLDGRAGTIVAFIEDRARIEWEPVRRPLERPAPQSRVAPSRRTVRATSMTGVHVMDAGQTEVPLWMLALENRIGAGR